jgi:hypothetical protein
LNKKNTTRFKYLGGVTSIGKRLLFNLEQVANPFEDASFEQPSQCSPYKRKRKTPPDSNI